MHRVLAAVLLDGAGSVEVDESDDTAALQDEIGRLDVTVNDALRVDRSKPIAQLQEDVPRLALREIRLAPNAVEQGFALHIFLHDKRLAVLLDAMQDARNQRISLLL